MSIRLEVKDFIAVVTIDNPPVNALDRSVELHSIFDSFADRSDVRVAILTGAGQRAFCAGFDTAKAGYPNVEPGVRAAGSRRSREMFNAIIECAVPVIGAINGYAVGAGAVFAASCDYLIASENASFGLPELDIGILGGARHMMRLFPQGAVRRANLTCKRIGAQEALRYGAVVDVVPPDRLMEVAMEEARIIAGKLPQGVRMAKATHNLIENMDLKNGYRYEQTQTVLLEKTPDALEARAAYREKRKPVFKG